jgi:hypothetical protein
MEQTNLNRMVENIILGASDEHTPQRSVRSEQRSQREKGRPPGGLRRIGPGALLLLSHRALEAMLLRRA